MISSSTVNEDWLRTLAWDFPGVDTVAGLLDVLGLAQQPAPEQRAALARFMALPSWQPAPAGLKAEAEAFTAVRSARRGAGWADAELALLPPGGGLLTRLEARDAHGRWVKGGGGSKASSPAAGLSTAQAKQIELAATAVATAQARIAATAEIGKISAEHAAEMRKLVEEVRSANEAMAKTADTEEGHKGKTKLAVHLGALVATGAISWAALKLGVPDGIAVASGAGPAFAMELTDWIKRL